MKNTEVVPTNGSVHPRLTARLKSASLFGAFTGVESPRFQKYLLQPKHILRNGWLLDPEMELGQRSVRAYILGEQPKNDNDSQAVFQRLKIDREQRVATLETSCLQQSQTIKIDMTTMEVVENELVKA